MTIISGTGCIRQLGFYFYLRDNWDIYVAIEYHHRKLCFCYPLKVSLLFLSFLSMPHHRLRSSAHNPPHHVPPVDPHPWSNLARHVGSSSG
jgi:hypothetical protein